MDFYRLSISITRYKFKEINSSLTDYEEEKLSKINVENLDYWKSDTELISYFLISNENLEFIKEILYSREIKFKIKNITSFVLNGDFNFEDEYFEEVKKDYINGNLTIDIILDKINKSGISSLNDYDKKFLESFS
jgi:hypothetical protein